MKKKQISILFLVLVIVASSFSWANNDELKKRQRELDALKAKIEALNDDIENNQNLQHKTNSQIQSVNTNIHALEDEITELEGQIDTTETEIDEKTVQLEEAKVKIADKNELLDERLRVMYKTGSIGYLEVLFGAEDFSDLLSRIDMVQKILLHDQNLLISLKEQRDDIANKKANLEKVKVELETLTTEKAAKQDTLKAELEKLVAYKEELKNDEAALAEVENQMTSEADQLTTVIKNLEVSETYVGGEMQWPAPGHTTITSPFGERVHPITKVVTMHTGVDISVPLNTTIVAAQSGTVIYADWYGGYGKAVIIDHGGGYSTLYGHNNKLLVKVGDVVKKGDPITKSGSTGFSTGPHLHFEVRINGDYVDPIPYVSGK